MLNSVGVVLGKPIPMAVRIPELNANAVWPRIFHLAASPKFTKKANFVEPCDANWVNHKINCN